MKWLLPAFKLFVQFSRISTRDRVALLAWSRRDFLSPAPQFVKMKVLARARDAGAWIETGTYMGETTLVLARFGAKVISIEPNIEFAQKAARTLGKYSNVRIIQGTSEDCFEGQVLSLVGEARVAFWLDGHYSSGHTYLGSQETPIEKELQVLSGFLHFFDKVSIFVDDFRCFVNGETDYPAPGYLSNWAVANGLNWSVEHDIFEAWN